LHQLLLNVLSLKHLTAHIPNAITVFNLLAGAMAVVLGAGNHLAAACLFVFLAGVFDFLDGLAARLLNVHSPIGAQLDSLADMVSFGLAPAFIVWVHLSGLFPRPAHSLDLSGLAVTKQFFLLFPFVLTAFAALRLAKFNIDTRQKKSFVGLPVPAMALFFASGVLVFHLRGSLYGVNMLNEPWLWDLMCLVFAILMVSPLRMFSLKIQHLKWRGNEFRYLFAGISLFLLISMHIGALPLIMLTYVVLSILYHIFDPKISRL